MQTHQLVPAAPRTLKDSTSDAVPAPAPRTLLSDPESAADLVFAVELLTCQVESLSARLEQLESPSAP